MPIRIASRQSDLAKFQAYEVGNALKKKNPSLDVQYFFRESLGDINQDDPLWKMPEKGVFTQDFRQGLISGEWDIVVHSWKDLPVEQEAGTEILATLPRADQRDLFLLKKKSFSALKTRKVLNVFSSSPRRAHNLNSFFLEYLPFQLKEVCFENVRGNILTRVRKLIENPSVDGLVVAKAAIDRLLSTQRLEFLEGKKQLQLFLDQCLWQVLPLSENPTAAAQGAIAIEAATEREDLKKILKTIHCQDTWDNVLVERKILKSHGGGCHQKIGVSQIKRKFGSVTFLKGESEDKKSLDSIIQEPFNIKLNNPCLSSFQLFERLELDHSIPSEVNAHFIARENALPRDVKLSQEDIIWTSGLKTWKALAQRGMWINGTNDSLGESDGQGIDNLFPDALWAKWTHKHSTNLNSMIPIVTYELKPIASLQNNWGHFKEYYWMSGSQFLQAIKLEPQILNADHYCGPGNTYSIISNELKKLKITKEAKIVLNFQMWQKAIKG
jgi:hydroxymethylbilane synthase